MGHAGHRLKLMEGCGCEAAEEYRARPLGGQFTCWKATSGMLANFKQLFVGEHRQSSVETHTEYLETPDVERNWK